MERFFLKLRQLSMMRTVLLHSLSHSEACSLLSSLVCDYVCVYIGKCVNVFVYVCESVSVCERERERVLLVDEIIQWNTQMQTNINTQITKNCVVNVLHATEKMNEMNTELGIKHELDTRY